MYAITQMYAITMECMKKPLLSVLMLGMFGITLSAQDATRGDALYKQQCVSCHGDNLQGRSGPPLTGTDFRSRYPTADLTEKIKNTMPEDRPGTLAPARQRTSLPIFNRPARRRQTPSLPRPRTDHRRSLSLRREISPS